MEFCSEIWNALQHRDRVRHCTLEKCRIIATCHLRMTS